MPNRALFAGFHADERIPDISDPIYLRTICAFVM